jgi:RNA polymerase sigma-70 factor, ECF subfamily
VAEDVDLARAGAVVNAGGLSCDDLSLVEAAIRNPDDFAHLYRRYVQQVYRYALARTGSPAVADDIVSDAMLAAFEALDRFDPRRGSFSGWLFTIVYRRVADWERAKRRGWKLFQRQRDLRHDAPDDPLDALVRRDDVARVRAAIARLRPIDREVILLRYSADLSSDEIARTLGISRTAARTRLSRALDRIAEDLRTTP